MYKILYKLNKKVLVWKWKKKCILWVVYIYINIKIFRYVRMERNLFVMLMDLYDNYIWKWNM